MFIIWDHGEKKLQELLSHVNGQEKRTQFTIWRERRTGACFSGPEDGEGGGEGGDQRVSEGDAHLSVPALEVKSSQEDDQAGGDEVPHPSSSSAVRPGGGYEVGAGFSQGPVHLKWIPCA